MTHVFCRKLYGELMHDVKKYTTPEQRKNSWSWKLSKGRYEFHAPNKVYWVGRTCCQWAAKYEGWFAYLRSIGADGY